MLTMIIFYDDHMKAVVKINPNKRIRGMTNEPNINHFKIILNVEIIANEEKRNKRVPHELQLNEP